MKKVRLPSLSKQQLIDMTSCHVNHTMESVKVKLDSSKSPLKQIRESLGLTQREFAKTIGVAERSVIRWENGHTTPFFTLFQVKALWREMQKLGLDIDDLPDEINNHN